MLATEVILEAIRRHTAGLTLYARALCDVPEDIVAVAFAKFSCLQAAPEDVPAWLYTVVRRAAFDHNKTTQRRRRREQQSARPEAWFIEREIDGIDAGVVVAALQELIDVEREVIMARLWGELTFEQIATVQQCSVSTVHRRYHAGIAKLQERFGVIWKANSLD